jgi:nitroreductase
MNDPAHPKIARPDHDVLDVIRERWSPRAFDRDRPVPAAALLQLFEAARWAPSSRNEQPWRFVVADSRRTPEAFERLIGALTGRNPGWAQSAPVLVLVAVRLTHAKDDIVNSHAWYDAGQAVAFLTLQATAVGLSIRQMQGFDASRARAACSVPDGFEPAVVMAVGYAGDPAALTVDLHRAAELTPRDRHPLTAFVYDGVWDVRLTIDQSDASAS